jgi:hypothetical protein
VAEGYALRMLFEGFWTLSAPVSFGSFGFFGAPAFGPVSFGAPAFASVSFGAPAFASVSFGAPTQLVLGLALVAAAILLAATTALPAVTSTTIVATFALARRARATERPRLANPDAPGRPRSRAPSPLPAAA